jgi:LuxR family maltose regulon positive regulatory protein
LGVEHLEQVGGAWSALVLYRTLARIQQAYGNWTDALDALDQAQQAGERTQVTVVVTQSAALRARLQLAQGDLVAAERWATNSGLSLDDPEAGHPGLREEEYLSLARVLDAQSRHTESLSLLARLLHSAEAEGRMGSVIVILTLQSLSFQTQGDMTRALTILERALALAEPEGYVRLFVDEGEPVQQLLVALDNQPAVEPSLRRYAQQLLGVFPPPASHSPRPDGDSLLEPLTGRELEVLRLIADGRTNPEIATALVLAVGTVKKHTNNLFGKLGASNRTQAVKRGRDLGLL